jgi:Family of unknown function (DUF6498)
MKPFKEQLTNIPLIALVVANMLPIYGVVFFGWDAFNIVLLYWAENIIIGFYNIFKIVFARVEPPIANIGKLFTISFFIIHYSGFVAVHGAIIFSLFGKGDADKGMDIGRHPWPCFLVFVQMLVSVIRHCWTTIPNDMKYAIGSLFLSRGVSFVHNYLLAGEYKTSKPYDLMFQPYSRIIVMHIAILVGGLLSLKMGSPIGVLIVLIALKTLIDVKLHLRQHRNLSVAN